MSSKMCACVAAAGVAAVLGVAGSPTALGQAVFGITRPAFSTGPTTVFNTNVTTGQATAVFDPIAAALPATAPGFTGMAYDATNRRMFASTTNGTSTAIYSLDVTNNWAATLVTSVRRPDNSAGMVIAGLAFDQKRRVLYGVREIGGAGQPEALFSINLQTGVSTVVLEFEPSNAFNFSITGVDWCPVTDRIYLADDAANGGRNIYSVNPGLATPTLDLVAPYEAANAQLPAATDFDGIAAGGGFLYLLSDSLDDATSTTIEGNGGFHRVYNLATGQWGTPIATPYPIRTVSTQLGRIDPTGAGGWLGLGCNRADVAGANQGIGFDSDLTADDIIVFLNWYFGDDLRADLAGANQSPTPDNSLTADDIIVFLGEFFAGCGT
ncbi:MAG: hypothetical protein MUE97_03695 [Phycisphaerales bacterium]|nr:hypothetical protein [Phycisphaerales bacterium]